MRILARLEPVTAEALSRSLRPGWTLCNAADLRELRLLARTSEFDVAVLDPLDRALHQQNRDSSARNFRFICRDLCLPVVFLTPISLEAVESIVALAYHVRVGVMYRHGNDCVERDLTAIEHAAAARLAVRVLHAIEGAAVAPLSSTIVFTVEHLFHQPSAFLRTGKALASQHISQAIVNRELRRAGLASLHILRRIARVAHAYQLVVEFGMGLKEVVLRVGAGSIDSLGRETKRLTGLAPARLCAQMTAEDLFQAAIDAATPGVTRRRSHTTAGLSSM